MTSRPHRIARLTHRISFTEDELDQLAHEFADYAALDIAGILKLNVPQSDQDYRIAQIACEVAHAIRCTVETLAVVAAPLPIPYRSPAPRLSSEFEPLKAQRT